MTSTSRPRVEWVDAGRGLAITLVVLLHATNWLAEAGLAVDGWKQFCDTVASIRLPLFFMMSGLFAGKWMRAPWPDLWRAKLSLFVWVYAVWSVISTFSFMLGLNLQGAEGNYLSQLKNLLWAPFLPRFELWFIWALALFFCVGKLIHRLPVVAQLTASGVLSFVALSGFIQGNTGWVGSAKYLFFFLVGLLLRNLIFERIDRASPTALSLSFLAWVGTAAGGTALGWAGIPGYYMLSCVLGVVAGIGVSKVLARLPLWQYLGTRTLPVYLTHTSIILVVAWVLWKLVPLPHTVGWGFALPPMVAALAIAASLALSRCADLTPGLRLLYTQPAWLSRARWLG